MVTPREAQVPPTSLAAFFHVVREQVGRLLLGDLLHLFDRHVRDEVHLGLAGAGLEAGLVFDQFGRRRDADLDREGAVVVVLDGDGHFHAVERGGLVVDLRHNVLNVYRRRPELGTERRARVACPPGTSASIVPAISV